MNTRRGELARMECSARSVSSLISLIWLKVSSRRAWSIRRSLIWSWTTPRTFRWWFSGSISWARRPGPDRLVGVDVHIVSVCPISNSSS